MAEHTHITPLLVQAIRSGSVPPRATLKIVLRKLASCCDDCRRIVEEAALPGLVPASAYRRPVERVTARLHDLARELERDYTEAARLVDQLRPLSPEQRLLRVRNALERFAQIPVGELVLDAARACLPGDLPGSLAWADLAGTLAEQYQPPLDDHRVRALAFQGNAHRALGDFATGQRLLFEARDLRRTHDVIDPEVGAELYSFLGSLYSDLAEWDTALDHLDRAVAAYELTGNWLGRARTFIQLGALHGLLDRTDEAIAADLAALEVLRPETDTTLYVLGRLNYAFHLQEAGHASDALEVLEYDVAFYEDFENAHIRPRVAWLRARLDSELGNTASAERLYLELQSHFASQEQGFHAALVSVELASFYHQNDRIDDVEKAARQAVELFKAHTRHPAGLSALMLLLDAARQRSATEHLLHQTASILRRAARAPSATARLVK